MRLQYHAKVVRIFAKLARHIKGDEVVWLRLRPCYAGEFGAAHVADTK